METNLRLENIHGVIAKYGVFAIFNTDCDSLLHIKEFIKTFQEYGVGKCLDNIRIEK